MQDSSKSFLIRDLLGDLLDGRQKNEGDFIIVHVRLFYIGKHIGDTIYSI